MPAALTAGGPQVVALGRVEQSTARFLTTIERLEKRINELEGTTDPAVDGDPAEKKPTESNGTNGRRRLIPKPPNRKQPKPAPRSRKRSATPASPYYWAKGRPCSICHRLIPRSMCFWTRGELRSIRRLPRHSSKKGMALERLGKLDEAIDCYDRAIALDNSMTMAYLNKGGVFNRLERYGEALQCYEKALRAQQKTQHRLG